MAWQIGKYSAATTAVYLNRTPLEDGKSRWVMDACSPDEFETLVNMSEMMGREPLTTAVVREILGPRALMGEHS